MNTCLAAIGAAMTALGLAATLPAIAKRRPSAVPLKMIASTGFLLAAVSSTPWPAYGWMLFAGLICCWIGDLALALPGSQVFLDTLDRGR